MTTERATGVPGTSLLIETLLPGHPLCSPITWRGCRCPASAALHHRRNVIVGPRDTHRFRVTAAPVIGPSGAVHAVQLWDRSPRRRPAATAERGRHRVVSYLAAHRTQRRNPRPRRGLPFRRAGESSRTRSLPPRRPLRRGHEPHQQSARTGSRGPLGGHGTVYGPHSLRTVHLAMRSMPAPHHHAWRGIIHDVTDTVTPAEPTLASIVLSAAMAGRAPTAVALMDVEQARLITWFTDPVPGIQWKGTHDDRDTPHPDDVVRIFQTMQRLRTGGEKTAAIPGVRLRRLHGGWTVVDARITVVPTTGPMMVLAEMTLVDTLR